MVTNERIEWIDIAKGIGILLVIFGHTFALRYSSYIYTFHMPLFFFLSGLLAKELPTFKNVLQKRINGILRPWAIIWCLSLLVVLAIPEWRDDLSIRGIIKEFYTTNTNQVQNSSLWYLVCFFVVTILFHPVSKVIKRPFKSRFIVACLIICCLVILYIKPILNLLPIPDGRLPFKIDTAMVALVFYCIGYYFKEEIKDRIKKVQIKGVIIAFLIWAALALLNGWTNLNSFDFGRIKLLFYPIALLGIYVCISAAYIIASSCNPKICKCKKTLIYYGKNSLVIFGFQSLLIRLYLLLFNHIQGLDMQLYQNNPIYHQVGSFVVVAFVLTPLVVYTLKRIEKLGIKLI